MILHVDVCLGSIFAFLVIFISNSPVKSSKSDNVKQDSFCFFTNPSPQRKRHGLGEEEAFPKNVYILMWNL